MEARKTAGEAEVAAPVSLSSLVARSTAASTRYERVLEGVVGKNSPEYLLYCLRSLSFMVVEVKVERLCSTPTHLRCSLAASYR